ncbi:putative zinc-finger transcription factor [Rosellinia necatrix]|uniref:Putative zinc-finger transcription factor n=1 Tax=Rosellinia necatrix TaxID=77044 RepID=A0A1W2TRB2_ROSNE|nr:putative zinc-finger transcription factor [Rosellinia necatrix]
MPLRLEGRHPFLNTTSQDIELYRYLSTPGAPRPTGSRPPGSRLWRQPQSEATYGELLYYFRDTAHRSLATFSPATSQIRDVIMSMIYAHDTVSGRALLCALLAFSSLHRSGPHPGTISLKVAALEALSASTKEAAQGSAEAAQHVAACMILCAFEILLPSENSGEWLWYIRGAMEIVQRNEHFYEGDRSSLVDWVYYHNSLSRFTLFHWRHKYLATTTTDTVMGPIPPPITQCSLWVEERATPPSQGPPLAVLSVLSEICDVLLDPSDPGRQAVEYQDRLRALEWKVDNLPPASSVSAAAAAAATTTSADETSKDLEETARLYRLATRVYLARASQDPRSPSSSSSSSSSSSAASLDELVESAFAGPVRDCYCRHFFPLLIIACEARTDARRAAILRLIERTEARGYVRSMRAFRAQVRAFWVQRDLHADGDLVPDYLGLMGAVVSSDRALPSYV